MTLTVAADIPRQFKFGPLTLTIFDDQRRGADGKLVKPPVLEVHTHDAEYDTWRSEEISFGAVEALSPTLYVLIVDRLAKHRLLTSDNSP